jgi:hypothetical protein
VLNSERSTICFEGEHIPIFAVSLFVLLVLSIGLPLAMVPLLRKFRPVLNAPVIRARFGFLYESNKSNQYLFGAVVFGYSFLVAFSTTFLSNSPTGQIVLTCTASVVYITYIVLRRPFSAVWENTATCTAAMITLLSQLLSTRETLGFSDKTTTAIAGLTYAMCFAMILVLLGFAAVYLYHSTGAKILTEHIIDKTVNKSIQSIAALNARRAIRRIEHAEQHVRDLREAVEAELERRRLALRLPMQDMSDLSSLDMTSSNASHLTSDSEFDLTEDGYTSGDGIDSGDEEVQRRYAVRPKPGDRILSKSIRALVRDCMVRRHIREGTSPMDVYEEAHKVTLAALGITEPVPPEDEDPETRAEREMEEKVEGAVRALLAERDRLERVKHTLHSIVRRHGLDIPGLEAVGAGADGDQYPGDDNTVGRMSSDDDDVDGEDDDDDDESLPSPATTTDDDREEIGVIGGHYRHDPRPHQQHHQYRRRGAPMPEFSLPGSIVDDDDDDNAPDAMAIGGPGGAGGGTSRRSTARTRRKVSPRDIMRELGLGYGGTRRGRKRDTTTRNASSAAGATNGAVSMLLNAVSSQNAARGTTSQTITEAPEIVIEDRGDASDFDGSLSSVPSDFPSPATTTDDDGDDGALGIFRGGRRGNGLAPVADNAAELGPALVVHDPLAVAMERSEDLTEPRVGAEGVVDDSFLGSPPPRPGDENDSSNTTASTSPQRALREQYRHDPASHGVASPAADTGELAGSILVSPRAQVMLPDRGLRLRSDTVSPGESRRRESASTTLSAQRVTPAALPTAAQASNERSSPPVDSKSSLSSLASSVALPSLDSDEDRDI